MRRWVRASGVDISTGSLRFWVTVSATKAPSGKQHRPRLLRVGIPDSYCTTVGTQSHLREHYGLTGQQIARRILEELA